MEDRNHQNQEQPEKPGAEEFTRNLLDEVNHQKDEVIAGTPVFDIISYLVAILMIVLGIFQFLDNNRDIFTFGFGWLILIATHIHVQINAYIIRKSKRPPR